ncbi:MAG: NUDIX domain-containing protein [Pseudomonadota bacterium]
MTEERPPQPSPEDKSSAPKATPLPSATVLLLREGATDMEVFMVVRHHQIDFASGALVFPGGKADAADFNPELRAVTDGGAEDPDELAVQLAAIRECFEECGVLLARDARGQLIGSKRLSQLEAFREPLNSGDLTLKEFVRQESLRLAADLLVPFARWITPDMMPKRFDTWFYLVAAPTDQLAVHDGYESVDSIWISPATALSEAAAGQRTIIFPTLRNLEKLALSNTPAAAMEAAAAEPLVTVEPWTEQREEGVFLCIPKNAGYPVTEEPMQSRH